MSHDKIFRSVISAYFDEDKTFGTDEIREAIRVCPAAESEPFEEAWLELKHRLNDAETSLLVVRNRGGAMPSEKRRIDAKLEGLRLAIEYMRELESSFCVHKFENCE